MDVLVEKIKKAVKRDNDSHFVEGFVNVSLIICVGAMAIVGSITLFARFFGAFASNELISNLSFVGSALIFCVGINIAFDKKFRVGNMLPTILIPVFYELIKLVI